MGAGGGSGAAAVLLLVVVAALLVGAAGHLYPGEGESGGSRSGREAARVGRGPFAKMEPPPVVDGVPSSVGGLVARTVSPASRGAGSR